MDARGGRNLLARGNSQILGAVPGSACRAARARVRAVRARVCAGTGTRTNVRLSLRTNIPRCMSWRWGTRSVWTHEGTAKQRDGLWFPLCINSFLFFLSSLIFFFFSFSLSDVNYLFCCSFVSFVFGWVSDWFADVTYHPLMLRGCRHNIGVHSYGLVSYSPLNHLPHGCSREVPPQNCIVLTFQWEACVHRAPSAQQDFVLFACPTLGCWRRAGGCACPALPAHSASSGASWPEVSDKVVWSRQNVKPAMI